MCRSGIDGGRRCPSHSDPAAIAARNARRRVQYAKKTAVKKYMKENPEAPLWEAEILAGLPPANETKTTQSAGKSKPFGVPGKKESAQPKVDMIESDNPLYQAEVNKFMKESNVPQWEAELLVPLNKSYYEGKTLADYEEADQESMTILEKNEFEENKQLEQEQLEHPTYDVSSRQQNLGITATPNTETNNAFRQETITGIINYKNLDENSYKDFGFEERNILNDWPNNNHFDTRKLSEIEVKDLSKSHKAALTAFTGNHYSWVNKYTFNPKKIKYLREKSPFSFSYGPEELFPTDPNKAPQWFDDDSYSQENLKAFSENLDAALAQGPKKQRVVYRGVRTAEITDDPKKSYSMSNDEVHKWVDENRKIGQEIVFDGYTSASWDTNTGVSYGGSHRVMYEILTPEGVAISSISNYQGEEEVLLPRGQRYMIVGKQHHERDHDEYTHLEMTVIQLVAINSKGEILDGTNSDPIEPLVKKKKFTKTTGAAF